MNTYYVPVVLKITAETAEQAQDYAFNDLTDMGDDVISLQSIGQPTQEAQ
jgi:hypothetical protein